MPKPTRHADAVNFVAFVPNVHVVRGHMLGVLLSLERAVICEGMKWYYFHTASALDLYLFTDFAMF